MLATFTTDQISKVINGPKNMIRNLAIIAHVDHGKTTLSDALVKRAGGVSAAAAGDKCVLDILPEESEGGITIKSTGFSAAYPLDDQVFMINLIDSPGHIDFNSEVTAALRVTDGAVVVVDCVEGVCIQTRTVLQQALQEMVVPTLVLNKMDRIFLEVGWTAEETKTHLERIIDDVNTMIETYRSETFNPPFIDPEVGNVVFASGYHQWGFRLDDLCRFFPEGTTPRQLWKHFDKMVFPSIQRMIRAINEERRDKWEPAMTKFGVKVPMDMVTDATNKKQVYRAVMGTWLPVATSVLRMARDCLPNPRQAQAYRMERLFEGRHDPVTGETVKDPDDPTLVALKNCDPEGPLVVYISKLAPKTSECTHFYAFGRVFSGTFRAGEKFYVMGPDFVHGAKSATHSQASAQQVVTMLGWATLRHPEISAGNTMGALGLQKYMSKTGTLTTDATLLPLKDMSYSVKPIVRQAVCPKAPGDQPRFVDALKKLRYFDSIVSITTDEDTGETIIGAVGEFHARICLNRLEAFMKGRPISVAEPMVSYRETVGSVIPASDPGLTKSPNAHNRLWMRVFPMSEAMVTYLEDHPLLAERDPKEICKMVADDYPDELGSVLTPKRVWGYGPNDDGTCLFVDATTGAQYMTEIQQSVMAGFRWAAKDGPLCGETMAGVIVALVEVTLHADAIHRGMGQILPTARACVLGNVLRATPGFLEPILMASVTVPSAHMGGVFTVISSRRGSVIDQIPHPSLDQIEIRAHLPAAASFGIVEELRSATSGSAFPSMTFDHWARVTSDPFEEGSPANKIAMTMRKKRGLKEAMDDPMRYLHKL